MLIRVARTLSLLAGVSAAVVLAACGSPDALTITGTAAKGNALSGAAVTATCATGTGTATVAADGSYRVDVIDGTGPCLLKVVSGPSTYYSVTTGTGSSVVANVTPLTNLFVDYLRNLPGVSAASPETFFALPAARNLLANTTEVQSRAVDGFLPYVRTTAGLTPAQLPASLAFLSTSFVTDPATSVQDAVLEILSGNRQGATTPLFNATTGAPSGAAATTGLQSNAATQPPVTAGGTGGGGTGGGGTGGGN
jgi:hypothetical protein